MSDKRGSLTIEASIALTSFMFLIVTILSFSVLYKAQSIVSHATLQASQAMAIETYYRETISSAKSTDAFSLLIKLSNILFDTNGAFDGADDWYASLGDEGTDFYRIVKKRFVYAIAQDEASADRILEDAGIEDGLDGINFTRSAVSGGDIIVHAQYKVNLPFSFFGKRTITLTKAAKSKAFKAIDDDNGYKEPTTN